MAKYKLTNFLKESHPANDQWLEAFKDALGFETLISPSYLMGKYGHLRPEEAAQLFMNDSTATQMAKDKEKFSKETGLEGDAASVAEGEFKFRPTETDAPGMQARPDGYLKEKSEVEESFDYQYLMKVRAGIIK
jgi:hypothetical protein